GTRRRGLKMHHMMRRCVPITAPAKPSRDEAREEFTAGLDVWHRAGVGAAWKGPVRRTAEAQARRLVVPGDYDGITTCGRLPGGSPPEDPLSPPEQAVIDRAVELIHEARQRERLLALESTPASPQQQTLATSIASRWNAAFAEAMRHQKENP